MGVRRESRWLEAHPGTLPRLQGQLGQLGRGGAAFSWDQRKAWVLVLVLPATLCLRVTSTKWLACTRSLNERLACSCLAWTLLPGSSCGASAGRRTDAGVGLSAPQRQSSRRVSTFRRVRRQQRWHHTNPPTRLLCRLSIAFPI